MQNRDNNTDRFGNKLVGFKPLTKEQECPTDEVDKGLRVERADGSNYTFDIIHVARGDSKGWRYWGKNIVGKNKEDSKVNVEIFADFFGWDIVASLMETPFNTQNQKYCRNAYFDANGVLLDEKKRWTDSELTEALRDRELRGESMAKKFAGVKELGEELKKLTPKTPEHTALMQKIAEAAMLALGL